MKHNVAIFVVVFLTVLFGSGIFMDYVRRPQNKKIENVERKQDIRELISKRNSYQSEYDLLYSEWKIRRIQRCRENNWQVDYDFIELEGTYEEFLRETVLKDSIEILNVMINNYKF